MDVFGIWLVATLLGTATLGIPLLMAWDRARNF
jgi:uncharacterized membrane protein YjgN (DUF898 family)